MGAHFEFAHTAKQQEVMEHIIAGADAGSFITIRELLGKISWTCSKQALLCSIRTLQRWGFVRKEYRGPKSSRLVPTPEAYQVFKGTPAPE